MAGPYTEAVRVLQKVYGTSASTSTRKSNVSIRSLCLNKKHVRNSAPVYALVCETLKYYRLLAPVVGTSLSRIRDEWLRYVLVYELLFGKGKINGGGAAKRIVVAEEEQLRERLERTCDENEELKELWTRLQQERKGRVLPRFVRVNEIVSDVSTVVQEMKERGHVLQKDKYSDVEPGHFKRDPHVPALLVFPPKVKFHADPLLDSGHIILQEKASCFPAIALSPTPHSEVIDACSAPGNKTTHLAALMRGTGRVFAFDKDPQRFKLLEKMVQRSRATNIKCILSDFSEVDPSDAAYNRVKYILVDPSCSGSGIANRLEIENEEELAGATSARLAALADLQYRLVNHAMQFPSVQRVVYSTCSIHREEDEDVVIRVLDANPHFHLKPIIGSWPRRGLSSGELPNGYYCVRARADDQTNGFFVACFERRSSGPASPGASSSGEGSEVEQHDHGGSSNNKGVLGKRAIEQEHKSRKRRRV